MPISFFAPNKSVGGGALYITFNSKEQSCYFQTIKQTAWDPVKKRGSFKGGATINLKLSQDEVGGLMRAIRCGESFSFFHAFGESKTSGGLNYYELPTVKPDGTEGVRKGFGFKITKDGVEIKVGLSLGSAERMYEHLRFICDHFSSAIYSADKKEAEERNQKKAEGQERELPPEEEEAAAPLKPKATPSDDLDF